MDELITVHIEQLQPGQLYLNADKVNQVGSWFNVDTFTGFIEVIEYDSQYVVIDGHTRLYHAYKNGMKVIPIKVYNSFDNRVEEALYKTCSEWCRTTSIYHIKDLHSRIIPAEQFKTRWIDRCSQWMNDYEKDELEDS